MENNPFFIFLIGASGAIISSLIGPYITQSKDRRRARADVVKTITEVETVRWGDDKYPELNKAIAELKSMSLIAMADRNLIDYYSKLALTSYKSAKLQEVEGGEEIWMIPAKLSDHIEDSLESLSLTLWHPWRTKLKRKKFKDNLEKKELKLRKDKTQEINWSR